MSKKRTGNQYVTELINRITNCSITVNQIRHTINELNWSPDVQKILAAKQQQLVDRIYADTIVLKEIHADVETQLKNLHEKLTDILQ